MDLNIRQKKILDFISTQDFVKTKDVLEFTKKEFEKEVSRITIVRDLKKFLDSDFLLQKGKGRDTKYLINPVYFVNKKIAVETYFEKNQEHRQSKTSFNFEIFDILKNDIFNKEERDILAKQHEIFLGKIKKLDRQPEILKKEFERILIEFSWKSSQIEGNTYSLLETEILLKENKEAKNKTKEETQMVLNHKKVFDFVLSNRKQFETVSLPDVEDIHKILTADLGIPFGLRKIPVGIIGTNYRPLDNIFQIKEAVEKMIMLINKKDDFFEKSFLILVLISYIQAFADGNKRTARMLSNAVLLANNSCPLSYRSVSEIEYKKASIIFYEINNLAYFKEIFIQQFQFAVKNYF